MYPRMDQHKLMLIVELLEELDPRDASDVKSDRQTVDQRKYSEGYLDALMNPLEKPKFDFEALIERVVSSMSGNEKTKKLDFSKRTSEGNFKQYARDT